MRRTALIAIIASGAVAGPALAQDPGGASAPGGTFETAAAGGVQPGAGAAPVARLSAASPMRPGAPRITVRFDEPQATWVIARAVVLRVPGGAVVAQVPLGRVRTGREVRIPWRGDALAPGRYLVRVHARDRWNHQLRRPSETPGKLALVVRAAPAPKPAPAADPAPAPSGSGVFPVRGPFTYGSPFGEDRGSYAHQGVDMAAAAGTPVVAPTAGTVVSTAYQASAAGYYVVLNATNGHAYFFAHLQQGSFAVKEGQSVTAGALLGRVGSTGRSTGPHLHFEAWVDGWRTSSNSRPIDPMPLLRAWAA
jgi:murein DD-endopeptidase MepM/ murein hydrolase activator NlpD